MAFVGVKFMGQGKMEFHPDGSVTDVSEDRPVPVPPAPVPPEVKPPIVETVKQKAQEAVAAIEGAVKPKRRSRKPKASAE